MNPTLKTLELIRARISQRVEARYRQGGDLQPERLKTSDEDIKRDIKIKIRMSDPDLDVLDEP